MDWGPPGWKHLPKEGFEGWLDRSFFALGEVMVLGLPALLAVVMTGGSRVTLGAIVAVLTLALGVTFRKRGRTRSSTTWPGFRPSTVLARVLWYNTALAVAAYAGGAIDAVLAPGVGSVVFAAGVSVGAIKTLPWIAARTTALLSWWTWGRPPG